MSEAKSSENWIATRELVPRWSIGISGLVNTVVMLVTAFGIWWILFSDKGPVKLYTPLLGFSILIWILLIIVWFTEVFDFWPLKRNFLNNTHPLAKGGLLTGAVIAFYLIFIAVFLFLIIGKYGITYFNWHSLHEHGKLGTDVLTARETTFWAHISLSVSFFWVTILFVIGGAKDIWNKVEQPRSGLAVWSLMAVISIPLYFIFFHPHIGSMFYPNQIYAAVPPWWKNLAHTSSAEFNMGWIFLTVNVIFYTVHMWEGRPWNLVEKQPWKFIFLFIGSFILGILLFKLELYIMDYLWDEAYMGGQNDANFGWRYSHCVTMAIFILTAAIILNFYFNQAFSKMSLILRGSLKTIIAIVVGLLFAMAYYAWAPTLLGVASGVSHPTENATAFLLLIINLLMIQDNFMDGWPGYRLKK